MPASGRLAEVVVFVRQLSSSEAEAMRNCISPGDAEVYVARHIQSALELETCPRLEGMRFAAHRRPSGCLGGDFHCVIPGARDRFTMAIGSVSGGGLQTALAKALVLGAVRAHGQHAHGPGAVVSQLGALLARVNQDLRERQVTCSIVYAAVDPSQNAFEYCNAGHPAPVVRLRGGRRLTLAHTSAALGDASRSGARGEKRVIELDTLDRAFFYTLGLIHMLSRVGELDEEELVQNLFEASAALPVDTQLEAVLRTVRHCRKAGDVSADDLTVLLADFAALRGRVHEGARKTGPGATSRRNLDGFRATAPGRGGVRHVPA
jgi:serine phosphatase RsbU (regulator of sigma subunit)